MPSAFSWACLGLPVLNSDDFFTDELDVFPFPVQPTSSKDFKWWWGQSQVNGPNGYFVEITAVGVIHLLRCHLTFHYDFTYLNDIIIKNILTHSIKVYPDYELRIKKKLHSTISFYFFLEFNFERFIGFWMLKRSLRP